MAGFHKDKETKKWYCDNCGKEILLKEILRPYDYFGKDKEHICEIK